MLKKVIFMPAAAISSAVFLGMASTPAMAQSVGGISPTLVPTPSFSCTVKVGQPHYSDYWGGLGKNYIDTHTYVDCNLKASSITAVAYLYSLGLFGSTTYWVQEPPGSTTKYNVYKVTSAQSKAACTYGEIWWYGATGLAYLNGGPAQNASNSYSNVQVPCEPPPIA